LRRSGGVEHERGLAAVEPARVVAVHRPVARLDGAALLLGTEPQVISVRDARAERDDQRGTGIRLGFLERTQRLRVARTHRGARATCGWPPAAAVRPRSFGGARSPGAATSAAPPSGAAFDGWPPVWE